ncbi:MAG: PLP-dependent transferase [Armatimonadetes bacterium]|nr:PLP-dependent transferase [Armatimonadota bacterium]
MAKRRFDTDAVHAGEAVDLSSGALTTPVVRSTPFVFSSLDQLDRYAAGEIACFEYARTANPTTRAAELKIAALEHAEDAIVLSSGMAAISTTYLGLLNAGDHVLVTDDGYKRTLMFARDTLARWGITGELVDSRQPLAAVAAALRPNTRLVLTEAPTNPHLRMPDIRALADLCHANGTVLAIDATLASPANLLPLTLGADLVLHSATKYLAGHNDVLAGAIAGDAKLIEQIRALHLNLGAALDPEASFLLLRGMKTLGLRVERANASAQALAQWLEAQPKVKAVYYAGLPSNPDYAVAHKQMCGFGGLLSFELDADMAGIGRFFDALRVFALGTSLGGVESLALPMGVFMRNGLTDADRAMLDLPDELIRLSVGVEDATDLREDLAQALAAV